MSLLTDYTWQTKYDSDTLSLIKEFYEPALNCAVRYDRSTGFFSARILTLAALGIEGLIRNHGVMRLVISCTLQEEEVDAIARGEKLRQVIDRSLSNFPLIAENAEEADTLELLSWMIARGYLEVKLALPCSLDRQPLPIQGIGHFLQPTPTTTKTSEQPKQREYKVQALKDLLENAPPTSPDCDAEQPSGNT